MRFTKMHGLGNDFAIVDPSVQEITETQFPELARKWCDRHFGVGADGLIFVLPTERADFRMRIFNPDGSEAEMCGNGIRCFGKYVYEHGLSRRNPLTVETLAGLQTLDLNVEHEVVKSVEVDMGQPILRRSQIPMSGEDSESVIGEPLDVEGAECTITCVSMGNPHGVLFVEDLDQVPLSVLGPQIETHPAFPQRINVHFAQVLSPTEVRMRVWERGAGITLACGTGACAVLVAGVLTGQTERKATVHLPGGPLQIEWKANGHLAMTGPAAEVFDGETA
ncbi:MAG: diaminopimelate epimerase [Armatimonadetes bacterium]|nr:diaminopimelate epimerase [Armatimonadota bacterium]